MGDILQLLKDAIQIPGLLKEIYGDIAKPGVTQAGKALSTIIGLGNTILWPIAWANERSRIALESNLEKYRKRLEAVPAEEITPVPPEIGVPIAEKLSYVTDDELSDLYVNLLANASTINTAQFAHPAFVHIINCLSPDEALLLKEIDRRGRNPIPFIAARWIRIEPREYIEFAEMLSKLEVAVPLAFPQNLVAYFSNLAGLGIVQIERQGGYNPEPEYRELEEFYLPYFEKYMKEHIVHPENFESESEFGRIDLTPFGKLFLDACLKKLNSEGVPGTPAPPQPGP